MTEAEWLANADPMVMLSRINADSLARKTLLLTEACCRRIWHLLPNYVQKWTETIGDVVEGRLVPDRIEDEWEAVELFLSGNENEPQGNGVCYAVINIAACCWNDWGAFEAGNGAWQEERKHHADFVRDIFGNPFRPVTLDPAWLRWNDGCAVAIAQRIYDERRFEDMPILADALEEAGCTNGDVLSHCRAPGEHVRGCWVVDLVLEKS